MHCDLDSLDNFVDIEENIIPEAPSVVVPMDDMELILTQMWKSRQTEPKIGELYEKYKTLTTDNI